MSECERSWSGLLGCGSWSGVWQRGCESFCGQQKGRRALNRRERSGSTSNGSIDGGRDLHVKAARLGAASRVETSDEELEAVLLDVLADEERSGVPPKFSAEQLTQIIALACKAPKDLGIPVTHWTPKELAIEAIRQGIVPSISQRHIARFFGGDGSQAASLHVLAQL